MRYYKSTSLDGEYIVSIGTGFGGAEITEQEYFEIMDVLGTRPYSEGKGYRLRTDLTWEEYDLPPQPEPPEEDEATEEDYQAALNSLGVSTDEEE